ncbi:hypothetical protein DFH08DRAFT_873613 [Mycena albidolilacea]|uniref:Uncharacterized protein n=1 Tax=Mycena albidolilacea TaxID=1033008 RepID=A0AAD7EQC2_9AGAR|nr:hypothetical protein DFH08DRAFT_873613 [Mycena albidolilacea]
MPSHLVNKHIMGWQGAMPSMPTKNAVHRVSEPHATPCITRNWKSAARLHAPLRTSVSAALPESASARTQTHSCRPTRGAPIICRTTGVTSARECGECVGPRDIPFSSPRHPRTCLRTCIRTHFAPNAREKTGERRGRYTETCTPHATVYRRPASKACTSICPHLHTLFPHPRRLPATFPARPRKRGDTPEEATFIIVGALRKPRTPAQCCQDRERPWTAMKRSSARNSPYRKRRGRRAGRA